MPRTFAMLLLSALFVTVAPSAPAALTWEATVRSPKIALGAEQAVAEFPFRNTGREPVVILNVRASCGCTVPELEKRNYAPGEAGVIKATFNIGDRLGAQHSVIYVQTDDPAAEPLQLHLHLDIPQPLEVNPRVVSWTQGEEAKAKVIELSVHPEAGLELTGVETKDLGYTTALRPGDAPGRYRLEIVPTSTAAASRAGFVLQTSKPLAKPSQVFAFVR